MSGNNEHNRREQDRLDAEIVDMTNKFSTEDIAKIKRLIESLPPDNIDEINKIVNLSRFSKALWTLLVGVLTVFGAPYVLDWVSKHIKLT